jgi:hypothetical protein
MLDKPTYVGVREGGETQSSVLSALGVPLIIAANVPQGQEEWRTANFLEMWRACFAQIRSDSLQGNYDLCVDRVQQTIGDLRALDLLRGKVAAVMSYSLGIALHNSGDVRGAVRSLEESLTLLETARPGAQGAGQPMESRLGRVPWVLNPLSPISDMDIWHVKAELLQFHCELSIRLGTQTLPIGKESEALFRELKDHKRNPSVCALYAKVLSSYALFLRKTEGGSSSHADMQVLRLRREAFESLDKVVDLSDPRLLHSGMELARELYKQAQLAESADLLAKISPHTKGCDLTRVDILILKAGLCQGLMSYISLSETADGIDCGKATSREINACCEKLDLTLRIPPTGKLSEKAAVKAVKGLADTANQFLHEASEIISSNPTDVLLQGRVISLLEQMSLLAALQGQEKKSLHLNTQIDALKEARRKWT